MPYSTEGPTVRTYVRPGTSMRSYSNLPKLCQFQLHGADPERAGPDKAVN